MTTSMFNVGDWVEINPTEDNVATAEFLQFIKLGEVYRVEGLEVSDDFGGGLGVKIRGKWYGSTWFRLSKTGTLKQYFDV